MATHTEEVESFFPLYVTVAEFDIDRGPVIRAQLPSPIAVVPTCTHLSPTFRFSAPAPAAPPAPASNVEGDDGEAKPDDESNEAGRSKSPPPPAAAAAAAADPRPENYHQLMSDQMLPDGSDRNERNTSWMILNRSVEHDSGVLCCVFQMSTVARWQPRAALLAVIDGTLTLVDMFEFVRGAPSFSVPKSNVEQQVYRPIGCFTASNTNASSTAGRISLQELGALPSDKMAQVAPLFALPPLRAKPGTEMSIFDTISNAANLEKKDLSHHSSSSSSAAATAAAAAAASTGSSYPQAYAHIRGECCSISVAFSSRADLDRVRGWLQTEMDISRAAVSVAAKGGGGAASTPPPRNRDDGTAPDNNNSTASTTTAVVSRRCLYGAVVSVTKKMSNARRGSVNFSVSVCSAQLRWLHCLQSFLEVVALACCDATALPTPELISKQIADIADSAYSHLVSKILPVAAGMSTGSGSGNSAPAVTPTEALAAVTKRLILKDDTAWLGLQCIADPWKVPTAVFEEEFERKSQQETAASATVKTAIITSSPEAYSGRELSIAMLPAHALPPAPLQPVIAATGTSSSQSLTSEHYAAAHLSSLIGAISETGFARLLLHVLLQRRVLFISRGGGGSKVAQVVMAVGSLFSYFDEHFFCRRVVPYASVSLLDVVVTTDGVLAGTVNPLFETKFGKTGVNGGVDVIVDMDQRFIAVAESVGGPGKKEGKKNREAAGAAGEFCGLDALSRWTEDFGRELRTSLLRQQAAAMSSGGAMMQRNEESSVLEDLLRVTVVRELSILLWSMARSGSGSGIPRRCAESRVFLLGKWLGRGRPESAVFGEHVTRLLLPLDDTMFLDESMIVSFLQHGVRLATAWSPEECLRVVATAPRSLQCLSVLTAHSSSVVRLLATILLQKLRQAHPVIESCLASQCNAFMHFLLDVASASNP